MISLLPSSRVETRIPRTESSLMTLPRFLMRSTSASSIPKILPIPVIRGSAQVTMTIFGLGGAARETQSLDSDALALSASSITLICPPLPFASCSILTPDGNDRNGELSRGRDYLDEPPVDRRGEFPCRIVVVGQIQRRFHQLEFHHQPASNRRHQIDARVEQIRHSHGR
jgi:hypothetical protein